MEIVKAGVQVI